MSVMEEDEDSVRREQIEHDNPVRVARAQNGLGKWVANDRNNGSWVASAYTLEDLEAQVMAWYYLDPSKDISYG